MVAALTFFEPARNHQLRERESSQEEFVFTKTFPTRVKEAPAHRFFVNVVPVRVIF